MVDTRDLDELYGVLARCVGTHQSVALSPQEAATLLGHLGRMEHLRATLIRSDSMLSLLRHRCGVTIPWGTLGMPDSQDIDEIIGASRQALRETGAY